jgi:hypothetical protein
MENNGVRQDTVTGIDGVQRIYDDLPEFFLDDKEEKVGKNGTARFQNLEQLIAGEGEFEQEKEGEDSDEEKSNSSDDNPLLQQNDDSFEKLINTGSREKGFSISDIPKIPIDKVRPKNDENYGYILNNKPLGFSQSYDPTISDYRDPKSKYNASDMLSMYKSSEMNSSRLPFKFDQMQHQLKTDRLSSLMNKSSHTNDMIREILESESNTFTGRDAPEKSELYDEISTLRDKIYRSLEDYKNNVDKLSKDSEEIKAKLLDGLDPLEEELHDTIEMYAGQEGMEEISQMERQQEQRTKEIERTQKKIMEKDKEFFMLSERVRKSKLEFGVASKTFLGKVGQSEEEFEQLRRELSDLQFELCRVSERVRNETY